MTCSPPSPRSQVAFLATVIAYARSHAWLVFHDYHSKRNPRGWADLVMVRAGRLIMVELKSSIGRLRPEQAIWMRLLSEAGVETHVWQPSDLPEIIAIRAQPIRSRLIPASVCLSLCSWPPQRCIAA